MKGIFTLLVLLVISGTQFSLAQEIPVFQNGLDGFSCFRIPAMINVNGQILAFAEGRKNNCSDFGNNDIVMKTSQDKGKSWSTIRIVVDYDSLQAGNPAPVVDLLNPLYPGGRIFLFYNTGNAPEQEVRQGKGLREIWYITSDDQGKTWSQPVNITSQVHKPFMKSADSAFGWRGYATTPGHALQLSGGKYKGRIYVAANHTEGNPTTEWTDGFSHGFYSDDHGNSFYLSSKIPVPGSNEAIAAELADGGILLNARNQKGSPRSRIIARSHTGGFTWDTAYYDKRLVDPVCQASMLNAVYKGRKVILFSNPASEIQRINLSVRMSFDDGITWPGFLLAVPGDAAYNDLAMVSKKELGILFEKGSDGGIFFKRVRLNNFKFW